VGFQTSEQANAAVAYFDKSFAGTARLSVSLAFSKKKKGQEAEDYRPWSKHSEGSSRYAKLHEKQEEEEALEEKKKKDDENKKAEDDVPENDAKADAAQRKRDEFLSAMGMSNSKEGNDSKIAGKSKFWANDDAIAQPGTEQKSNNANPSVSGPPKDDESSSSAPSDSDDDSDSSSDSDSEEGMAKNTEKKKGGIASDLDFLKSKQVIADILSDDSDNEDKAADDSDSSSDSDDSSSDSDSSSSDGEDDAGKDAKAGQKSQSSTTTAVLESSSNVKEIKETTTAPPQTGDNNTLIDRLFVRNLPFTTTEEDLHETFSHFGNIVAVHIPVDDSKRNKGYAFITFESNADAKLALETMDGEDFQGRLIHILPARPSVDLSTADIDDPNLTYKERQTLIKQKEAEKSSKGWSASFLRGDAVVDNMSDRLGVSKGDILNVKDGISSGNAAVRLALGETHIISENIAFFDEHGVDVTVLEGSQSKKKGSASKRSKTMVLVKNLPYDTSLEDLTKVFHGIGGDVPQRILLPPSKTAALIEYGHATDARRAFRRLAYKKFKHVPLYLEWAPMKPGGVKPETPKEDATKNGPKQKSNDIVVKDIVVKPGLAEEDPSTETAENGSSQTIYVKNLNFTTSEDQLNKAFGKAGFQPRAVKIPTKAAPIKKHKSSSAGDASNNNNMKQVSMGFGFVEFPSEEDALKAMKSLQGKLVDGHALEIKLSTKSLSSSKAPPVDKTSKNTKIMVRNVPFEATRTELLQLFGSFGQLKKVRLPKKFDGTHRGFAFCEFVTSKEAQNAMATLSRTHLYGRHLVLEWATAVGADGDVANVDVDTVRQKAKRDVMSAGFGGGGGGKKGKHLKF